MVDPPLVVAVGGDGTVRLAAAAVAGRGIPLAVVPCGTGNVLGSSLGIRGMGRALEAIRHGDPQVMDLASARWGAQGSPDQRGGRAGDRRGRVRDGSRRSDHGCR